MIQFEGQHNNRETFVIYDTILKTKSAKFLKTRQIFDEVYWDLAMGSSKLE